MSSDLFKETKNELAKMFIIGAIFGGSLATAAWCKFMENSENVSKFTGHKLSQDKPLNSTEHFQQK